MEKIIQLVKRRILQFCWGTNWFPETVEDQKEFLAGLPDPVDDIERSYLQHKCQCHFRKSWKIFLLNCVAFPLLVIHSLQFRRKQITPEPHCDAVLMGGCGYDSLIPPSLREEYAEIRLVADQGKHRFLSKSDMYFLREVRRRYPFSFFFRYECMRKLAQYSYLIACYQPKALIGVQQAEATASLLSAYCAARGVEHICIMHGIQYFDISISFLRFNRFYVWDVFFKELFIELRAADGQFEIEVPPSLRFPQTESKREPVDYTYYLQGQSLPQIQAIADCLLRLKKAGAKVAVRPHPLHRESVRPIIRSDYGFIIEDPDQISLEDSVLRTKYAISLFSTVLMQAYYNGRTAVIDDICAPREYKELEKSNYMHRIMPHQTLSELLRGVEHDGKANQ